jgi:hypothetical protein
MQTSPGARFFQDELVSGTSVALSKAPAFLVLKTGALLLPLETMWQGTQWLLDITGDVDV